MTADTTPSLVERLADLDARRTQGPWRAYDCELVGDSTVIATIHWHSGRAAQNAADGELIGLVPEMIEALLFKQKALALAGETQIKLDLLVASWEARAEAAEANARRLSEVLRRIADGIVPPEQNGHYMAHRIAVHQARAALSLTTKEADRGPE